VITERDWYPAGPNGEVPSDSRYELEANDEHWVAVNYITSDRARRFALYPRDDGKLLVKMFDESESETKAMWLLHPKEGVAPSRTVLAKDEAESPGPVYLPAIAVADAAPRRADDLGPPPVGNWFDPQRHFFEGNTIVITERDWYPAGPNGEVPSDSRYELEANDEHWVAVNYITSDRARRFALYPRDDGKLLVKMFDESESETKAMWLLHPKEGVAPSRTVLAKDEAESPGPIHWILAGLLAFVTVVGLVKVARVLRGLDVLSTGLRQVPEGMRTAKCGSCGAMQYINVNGRIFICFSCHAANRLPREFLARTDVHQPLITPTGPLHSFEFRKGGDNIWQELKREEIPPSDRPSAGSGPNIQPLEAEGKMHFRGTYCEACARQICQRLSEFPTSDAVVAFLPEAGSDDTRININTEGYSVSPQIVGRPAPQAEGNSGQEDIMATNTSVNEFGLAQCVVCLDRIGVVVLLPCAHGSVCEECAVRIAQNRASGGAHCPHCRSDIETLVKIHQVEGDVARGVEMRVPMARIAR